MPFIEKALKNAYIGFWYEPGSNTLLYFPLTDDLNDHSWKTVTYSTTGSPTITTLNWVKCCQLNWSSTIDTSVTLNTLNNMFVSCWFYLVTSNNVWFFWNQPCWITNWFWFMFPSSDLQVWVYHSGWYAYVDVSWNFQNSWHLYSISNWKVYLDWVYKGTLSTTNMSWNQPICIWGHNQNSSCSRTKTNWYISDCIIENSERTAQEIQEYYNSTKSNYWIS